MSPSPDGRSEATQAEVARAYEAGWVAVHRMIREGLSWSGRERNCFFLNTGSLPFATASSVSGIDYPDDARAAARTDWDRDGKVDLVIANRSGPRLRVLRNSTATQSFGFVEFELVAKGKNRDAIGARVELELLMPPRLTPGVDSEGKRTVERHPATQKQVRTVRCGEGYLTQSSKRIHFGIQTNADIAKVSVRWPDGSREEFSGVVANDRFTLEQGRGAARAVMNDVRVALKSSARPPGPVAVDERQTIVLAARPPFPPIEALDSTGKPQVLAADGRPLLVMLWASWCEPCLVELQAFAEQASSLAGADVEIVALSLDAQDDRAAALDRLTRWKWPFGVAFGSQEVAEQFDVLQRALLDRKRRLPLPTSFLVDARNAVAMIRKGPLEPRALLDRLRIVDALSPREFAAPFPGTWLAAPSKPDLVVLERAFAEAGFDGIAKSYRVAQMSRIESSKAKVYFEMGVARDAQDRAAEAAEMFARAAELEPGYFDARAALGYALHRQGKLQQAIDVYRAALHLDPRHAATLHNLALALAANGELDAARAQVEVLEPIDAKAAAELRARLDATIKR